MPAQTQREKQIYSKAIITQATRLIMPWEALYGFPKTEAGIELLATTLLDLAGTADNLVKAAKFAALIASGCPKCPTPIDMRTIWCCSGHMGCAPADGIENDKLDLSDLMSGPKRKIED